MRSRLILISVLLLPTLIYIYFALGVPKAVRAPFFGPRHAIEVKDKNGNPKTDTAYYAIPPFAGRTTGGAPFDSKALDGHLYVAVFVYPDSLASLLPMLAEDLKLNRGKYDYARFAFFYPADSAGNPPAGAPDFAQELQLGADTAVTIFLPPVTFDTLHDKHYFVADPARKKDPWKRRSDAVLLDHKGRIRGYYDLHLVPDLHSLREDVHYIYFRDEASETIENSTIEQKKK